MERHGSTRSAVTVWSPNGAIQFSQAGYAILEFLALGLIAFALRAAAAHVSVLSDQDEAVYVIQARQWLQGGWPYVAVWDQHPVGLPAIFAVAGWLVGDTLLAARWSATLAVTVVAWLILRFAGRAPIQRAAGGVAALLYILLLCRTEGLEAQNEVFNNALISSASLLLFRATFMVGRPGQADARRLFAPGLLLGVALQVKYVVFPECVLLCLTFLVLAHARDRNLGHSLLRAGVLVACGLGPTILVVGAYALRGNLAAFLQANVSANVAYAGMMPQAAAMIAGIREGLRPLLSLLLIFAACLLVLLRRPGSQENIPDRRLMLWLTIWLVAATLDVCSPIKFWPHYFLALVPPLCVAVSVFLPLLMNGRPFAGRRLWVAFVIAGLLVPPGYAAYTDLATAAHRSQFDVPRLLVRDIGRLGFSGGLYVYNYQPIIYLLAGIKPPTKYVFQAELSDFASSSGADPVAEFDRIMAMHPRYVVTSDPPLVGLPDAIDRKLAHDLLSYRKLVEYTDPNDLNRRVTLLVANPPKTRPGGL